MAVTGILVAALSAVSLVSCGSDDDDSGDTAATRTRTAPNTADFSGTAPSALESLAESVQASLSAVASSVSARASEFEASVSAEVARANAAAQEQLKDVEGRGNATADVSLTGKPRADTGGLLAVVVNITNSTDQTASYAVQVDFKDSDGNVVETRYVGAEDLEPGERAQPLAISRKPPEPQLTASIAKAQRY
ncbi:FxLYD domain-containing protein [Streptomyces cinnabarinus]|uniref:FxLYD domain-containing protein n=2 Tax=Streptomyces cinnabarinus TaxID=67287 RepID=A0ABY7KRI8_9ACTN|nr:FxLYD domain-containing protein [Streptomyces cinnabarinus]WAZ26007.1 FxLYD domain-containing protein [Streptomyces cinnabarinus]